MNEFIYIAQIAKAANALSADGVKEETAGDFTFGVSLSLRPKTATKQLNFGLSPELRLTNHRSASFADVTADYAVFLCLFLN